MTDRSSVDSLPPGWNVEVRLRKNSKRDKLYTDPVSGYVFRSMKDVSRYLETGKLGRLAFKPKGKGIIGVELEDDNILSPAVAKKQKLELSSAGEHIKLDETVKDDQNLKSATTEKSGRLDTNFSGPHLPEAKDSEKIEEKSDFAENVSVSAPAVGLLPANQSLKTKGKMHENEKTQLGTRKSRKKKEYNLPRRASKRLAGLRIDPTPELKTSRAWQFGSLARRAYQKR